MPPKYLDNLKANQLYAYLQTLLTSGRGFSAPYREEVKKDEEKREKSYLLEKAEIYEGRRFTSRKTGKVYQVESGVIPRNGKRSITGDTVQQGLP